MPKKDYTIGLDIGTNSVGWAVIDNEFEVLNVDKKVKIVKNGKTRGKKHLTKMWGSRLFEEGKTADKRRQFRTTKRRNNRSHERLQYLRKIFAPEIDKIDKYFYLRMDESFLQDNDRNEKVKTQYPLFPTVEEEKEYHTKYPTIYHLRKDLAESKEVVDIRYIFLALNHILKNRGNFLRQDDGDGVFDDFSNIEVKPAFLKFLEKYNDLFYVELDCDKYSDEIEKALKSCKDSSAQLIGQIFEENKKGTLYQFIKLMFGLKPDFKTTFNLEKEAKLKFSDDEYDSNLEKLLSEIGSDFEDLFVSAKEVNNAISLADILTITKPEYKSSKTKLSASMVERYEKHGDDLQKLKELLKKNSEVYDDYFYKYEAVKENGTTLVKANYVGYVGIPKATYRKFLVNQRKIAEAEVRKPFSQKFATQERFYKYTKNILIKLVNLSESHEELRKEFLQKIEDKTFLLKQRTFDNGAIPYQLQLHELKVIINHQKKANFSFKRFIESKFFEDNTLTNEEAIYKILKFRIPYYVGPLRDKPDKNDTKQKSPWIAKNVDENIRPWNFERIVNQEESAVKFIERMQNDDTYLYGVKTLPKNSLTYQKYAVLNELTKVRLDGDLICPEIRQQIFNELFKKNKKVNIKLFKNYLNCERGLNLNISEIKGLGENSENENQFNNQFSAYQDLRTWYVDALSSKKTSKEGKEKLKNEAEKILDDEKYLETFEEIIKVLTVLPEDKNMKYTVLKSIKDIYVLDKKVIKYLAKKSFSGYGRLSGKLLGLGRDALRSSFSADGFGEKWTIVDFLEKDSHNRNFMELINDPNLTFKKQIDDSYQKESNVTFTDLVNELAGSPAIKRGILQSLKIVDEIVNFMTSAEDRKNKKFNFPKNIVIEMARENQTTQRGKANSKTRLKVLQEIFNAQWREATNEELANEKLFLYYLQDGKDAYTNDEIIFPLSNYDVDHIIPQSFIKDDSISNKVLTSSKSNRGKLDDIPSEEVAKKMRYTWDKWLSQKRIPKRKYDNLTKSLRGGLTEKDREGFIKRQIVETRQITKHVARILNDNFSNKETKIITVKSALASQLRKDFDLYKVRELNDYHHAHDAYLNAIVAKQLLQMYPHLEGKFVYGKIDNSTWYKDNQKATKERKIWLNISKSVAKEIGKSNKVDIIKNTFMKNATVTMHQTDRAINEDGRELYKATIAPKGKGANLLSKKFNGRDLQLDIDKYGGYLERKEAFITIEDGKLMSVKRTEIDDYKNNKIKIKRNQIFKNGEIYRTVASFIESGKWNQLKLTQEQNNYIYGLQTWEKVIKYVQNDDDSKKDKIFCGKDLVEQIEKYYPNIIEDIEKIIFEFIVKNKLAKVENISKPETFLHYQQKLEYLLALLNIASRGTTSDNKYTVFEEGVDIETGEIVYIPLKEKKGGKDVEKKEQINVRVRYGSKTGDIKVDKTTLIHQSITGLYETRIKL